MRKLTLLFALIGFAFFANAQTTATFKAFKVDIDFGYAIPGSSGTGVGGTKAGATFTIEPHYRLSDAFAVGLRVEGAGLAYITNSGSDNSSVNLLTSYCATGDYYLSNSGFRPFIGAGAGFFSQQSLAGSNNSVVVVAGATTFGFFPRVGFDAGHFRMSAAYDVVTNNNYANFTIGFFLGGGKK
jgi:hypothetical protein